MSNDYELHRVKYYSEADLSAPFCVTRIKELLKDDPKSEGLTIDDAIELFQCHFVLTKCLSDEAKKEDSYSLLIERAEIGKGVACEVIRSHLEDCGLRKTYECVCRNYKDVLIGLIADVGLFSSVSREDVREILESNPECILHFLTCKKLAKKYSSLLKLALVENPVMRSNPSRYHVQLICSTNPADRRYREGLLRSPRKRHRLPRPRQARQPLYQDPRSA